MGQIYLKTSQNPEHFDWRKQEREFTLPQHFPGLDLEAYVTLIGKEDKSQSSCINHVLGLMGHQPDGKGINRDYNFSEGYCYRCLETRDSQIDSILKRIMALGSRLPNQDIGLIVSTERPPLFERDLAECVLQYFEKNRDSSIVIVLKP